MSKKWDVTVIGGGLIGLATAWQLLKKHPKTKLLLLEKEPVLAKHQSGHNSGVVHSGIYYRPGSLKARYCTAGVRELKKFCEERNVPYKTIGKVIVATEPEEVPRLEELERRGKMNGVEGLELIDTPRLKEIEPEANGIKALYSPNTAIVDFPKVAEEYAQLIKDLGGEIHLGKKITQIQQNNQEIILQTEKENYQTSKLINCAGIYADRLAHLADPSILPYQIIPFRGEYYHIKPSRKHLVKGLIYPVPDPKFPFLGVHFTQTIHGDLEAGPNAVLALSREGYKKTNFVLKDCIDIIRYSGFWKMTLKYWDVGVYEIYRSYRKKAFLKALQRLVPSLQIDDLIPGGAGVRPQVVLPNGKMVDDFHIESNDKMIHILNAPSPGATASIAIGKHIADLYIP